MALTKTAKTSVVVFNCTLLSRVLGFIRILVQASTLGFFRLNDSYSFSNEIPNMMYELILGSLISSTLLPFFVKQYKSKKTEDDKSIFSFMFYSSGAIALLAVALAPVLAVVMTFLNQDSNAGEQRTLVIFFLYFFLPQIFFYAMTSTMQTYLAARHRFVASALAPVFNNLVVIAILLFIKNGLNNSDPSQRLDQIKILLGVGTTMGVVAIAGFLTIAYKRAGGSFSLGSIKNSIVKDMLHQSKWMAAYAMTNQIALFLIFALANKDESGISIYLAAWAYFQLPHGLIAMNITTIAMPKFSHDIEYEGKSIKADTVLEIPEKTKNLLRQTSTALITIIGITSALGIAISRPLMQLILVHGKVTPEQGLLSANVLTGFLIFASAFSFYIFVVRLSNVIGKTKEIFKINIIQNVVNIILALIFVQFSPIIGLSLAYSLSYFLVMPFAFRLVKTNFKTSPINFKPVLYILGSAVIGAYFGLRISTQFDSNIMGILISGALCTACIAIGSLIAKDEITALTKVFFDPKTAGSTKK
jgi:putative peptidoglycan lipid II flippase